MADGATAVEAHYGAFISYSHADTAFARRLHRRLETYRLPRRLAHRTVGGLPSSRRLKPIFRDRDELTAASDLTEAVREAIADSSHLIVVCSPAAAASEWVDLEIRLFRELHGDRGILAALHCGEPAEAIPPAMIGDGASGSGHAHQPLAADFRPHADGAHLALLKLVAVLAGVGLDQLVQRDAQRRVRRMAAIGAGSMAGTAAAVALALIAIEGRIAAEHERARSQGVVDYMLTDLRGKLKGVGRLDALDAVNKGASDYYKSQNVSGLTIAAQIADVTTYENNGEVDAMRGDYDNARDQLNTAFGKSRVLYIKNSNNPSVVFCHAQIVYWEGFLDWRTGDKAAALGRFQEYASLARKLVKRAPENPKYRLEPANAESNLGVFVLRTSTDTRRAASYFRSAQQRFEVAGQARPDDRDIQLSIADGYAWLGDVERLTGNYGAARAERMRQAATLRKLLTGSHLDFDLHSALVGNRLGLARISAAEGDLQEADRQLRQARSAAAVLLAVEPEDRDITDEIRIIELFQARVWMAMSPPERPRKSVIDALIGDCGTDLGKPHNEELATFCLNLRAKRRSAPAHVDSMNITKSPQRRTDLTDRWRLSSVDEDK